ncbi:MAG TPA: hypothetical protein VH063_18620 [Gaiellaceae bacterium]|nr:hypothetical protein [Gaiellaceae bacterium]
MTSRLSRGLAGRRGGTAFALYLIVAFAFIGLRVVAHPERRMVGGLFTDPQIFIWSFAWWPHAILHGQNPFFTHVIWEPDGFNLAWATSVPGLAIAFAPITLLFGPILAYNVASILMPALAAWTAFLLCRRLTGKVWPALAGGYIFGFSTYVLSAELTHIFTAAVFLVPVAALVIVRFLQEDLTRRGLAIRLGFVFAGQMLLSTEILFTLTLALVAALVLGLALVPSVRARLVRALVPIAAAYALAALLTLPFVYYALTGVGSRPPSGAEAFSGDLLNVVVPTMATVGGWWGRHLAVHFPANDSERGTYLGVPLLAIVGLFAWQRWRTGTGRFLLVTFALAVIVSLGSWLTVDGQQLATLPWIHLAARPFFRNLMPVRLMLFASLAASVMVALWAASNARPAWLRVALPTLAVLALVPNLSWHAWARTPEVPALFETSLYKSCIGRNENVLLLPFGTLGDTMIWQTKTGFWFRDAGGYISPFPPGGYTLTEGMFRVASEVSPPDVGTDSVLELVRLKHVTTIVLDARDAGLWAPVLRPFARPQTVGGALIYRLRDAPPLRQTCAAAAARA